MWKLNFSETSPSIGLSLRVNCGISGELGEHLFGLLEVFPGALGADVDTACGVAGPAIVHRVEVVVGVHVRNLLITVVALAVQPVLRLKSRRQDARAEVVEDSETHEEGNGETLKMNTIN